LSGPTPHSTIKGGIISKHNNLSSKVYLSTLELHGTQRAKRQSRLPSTMMSSENTVKFMEKTNFSTIEITLEPCIGAYGRLTLA
jgi:hypothetical protein